MQRYYTLCGRGREVWQIYFNAFFVVLFFSLSPWDPGYCRKTLIDKTEVPLSCPKNLSIAPSRRSRQSRHLIPVLMGHPYDKYFAKSRMPTPSVVVTHPGRGGGGCFVWWLVFGCSLSHRVFGGSFLGCSLTHGRHPLNKKGGSLSVPNPLGNRLVCYGDPRGMYVVCALFHDDVGKASPKPIKNYPWTILERLLGR